MNQSINEATTATTQINDMALNYKEALMNMTTHVIVGRL
jgi:hypothetical protein